jgi:hypothetical protein
MKKLIFFITIIQASISWSYAQPNIYTLQPDASNGIDAVVYSDDVNTNFGTSAEFIAFYWTRSGHDYEGKSLLKFDLSSLPAGRNIISAKISLYWDALASAGQTVGNNQSKLSRVTSGWNENAVTWSSLPSISPTDNIILSASNTATDDYIDQDVTDMVKSMYINQSSNYGFLIEQTSKSTYRSMKFASSDHTVASKRPKLVITFEENCTGTTKIFQPGPTDGIDAVLDDKDPSSPNGSSEEFISYDWTFAGSEEKGVSLLKFDLTSIPSSATISSAKLSLYYNPGSASAGQAGTNASYLKRVTSSWNENTVVWNTTPTTTDVDKVLLPTSTSASQDYLDIDIKNLIVTMHSNAATNYGMMLQLAATGVYKSLKFCSSDYANPAMRPKLTVCYTGGVGITENKKILSQGFPVPASEVYNVFDKSNHYYGIFNQQGSLVKSGFVENTSIPVKELDNGIYFIRFDDNSNLKLVVSHH